MVQTGNWRHVRLPSFGLQAGNNRSVISCIPADPNSFASLLQTNFVSSAVGVSNVAVQNSSEGIARFFQLGSNALTLGSLETAFQRMWLKV